MGIKFFCPNGHKLHVKSFLGGKLGICPHCGQKVRIPAETSLQTEQPEEALPTQHVTEGKFPVSNSTLESSAASKATIVAKGGEPLKDQLRSPTPMDLHTSRKHQPEPDHAPTMTGKELPSVSEPAGPSVRTEDHAPLLSGQANPAAVASDPIGDHPDAMWYVRPVSGGQFGPANGEVMRAWMDEGRVGPDALVWRQGWEEWKKAVLLFPTIGRDISPEKPDSPLNLSETPWVPPGKVSEKFNISPIVTARKEIPRSQQRSTRSMTIAIILLLIILALVPVLSLVMLHQFNSDPQVKQVQ